MYPSFTTDAVLLSDFARVRNTDKVADFGTGTGIIALLMYGRYKADITGFEIQDGLCDMANRSFAMNGLSDRLRAENMDYTEAYRAYNGFFNAVVCNPPYFENGCGINPENTSRAQTRTQLSCGISDTLAAANRVLKSGGRFFVCYPAVQLTDLLFELRRNALEPKRIRFVRAAKQKMPYLVMTEARKDGGRSLIFENDLVLSCDDGSETEEVKRIYHRA